jgi:hypothetical protein
MQSSVFLVKVSTSSSVSVSPLVSSLPLSLSSCCSSTNLLLVSILKRPGLFSTCLRSSQTLVKPFCVPFTNLLLCCSSVSIACYSSLREVALSTTAKLVTTLTFLPITLSETVPTSVHLKLTLLNGCLKSLVRRLVPTPTSTGIRYGATVQSPGSTP